MAKKLFNSDNFSVVSKERSTQTTFPGKPEMKANRFQIQKYGYLIYTWSDKALEGRVVNRSCHSFILRVPWNYVYSPFDEQNNNKSQVEI